MQEIIDGYRAWLQTLNYSPVLVKKNPELVREFMSWIRITAIKQIDSGKIKAWFDYLSMRPNKRYGGGLAINTLKSYRNAMSQLSRYLKQTGQGGFDLSVSFRGRQAEEVKALSLQEIEKLYEATNNYPDPMIRNMGLLAARERAMLGMFYGCGLRKNEGAHVETGDLDFNQNLLYVRKGKNYKERYVPIAGKVKRDFIHYLDHARPVLLRGQRHKAFMTGWYGAPMKGSAMLDRLHVLRKIAGIDKTFGLHTLRHSIATHLLQSGMKLEQIARFLGHSSLESTQIYTHIANEKGC